MKYDTRIMIAPVAVLEDPEGGSAIVHAPWTILDTDAPPMLVPPDALAVYFVDHPCSSSETTADDLIKIAEKLIELACLYDAEEAAEGEAGPKTV